MERIKFDLERAKAGDAVITGSGIELKQLTVFETNDDSYIYAITDGALRSWSIDGRYYDNKDESNFDLYMKPKMMSGFINVYEGRCGVTHSTNNLADRNADDDRTACIDLSQFPEGHGL